MKICITATGQGLDADIDPRFGRCQYFTIVDTDTMKFESVENSSIAASGGAGIQAAQFVANKGAEVVLTGNAGPNAYNTLNAAGISVITGVSGKVRAAVEDYKSGKLQPPISGPSVDSHFGMGGGTASLSGQGMGTGMGRGMGRGMGKGMPSSGPSAPGGGFSSGVSREEELNALKRQSQDMKSQLDDIMQRIDKLEGGNPTFQDQNTGISKVRETLKK